MIVFLGDSFTWGQGLQISKWISMGKSIDEINNIMPPHYPAELYDYTADRYRKEHHFPNLVSERLNKSYVTKFGNGGSNENMIHIASTIDTHMDLNGIDFFIVQFTELFRDEHTRNEFLELSNSTMDETQAIDYIVNNTISKINKTITGLHGNPKWFGFSWISEIGECLKNKYPDNYIPLKYDDIEYSSFDSLLSLYSELNLHGKYGVDDLHFSEEGHKVLSDSIIDKITTLV